ncbi:phage major capsid protein, HK97 family [Pseudoxanthobacter soli DSM 19599]|uniref:Phage major capsid protein, HK97 family n=1 Tax=Pseudoxanthobacter soli DSM 19599 TaxID=1123029 RepID=A0A1M7ZNI9_9HYPH|nr:phage major capsid protein [Pseudoxanthobacter soli]SHO66226.1 phage major capsid protein, HK97 family [Pseudoxanthobacter soli DSM 19599]
MQDIPRAPEAKMAAAYRDGRDPVSAFEDFMTAFETFKEVNDRRLDEIERRSSADAVTLERLDRIDHALDEQKRRLDHASVKARRPGLAPETGEAAGRAGAGERKAAFETYVRTGREAVHAAGIEAKALSAASPADGGYLVPEETEREIMRRLAAISPIRRIAGSRQVSGTVYRKPFSVAGPAVGWVGETAARPETAAPTLAELSYPTMELYAMPAATGTLLDDTAVDIDQWIAEEVETAFAEQEGAAFVGGNGINRPKGFLSYTTAAESAWSWEKIGYLATGAAGAFPASNPSDVLVDLVYTLKAGYRQNASWVMSRKTQAAIRKMKDAEGAYIWQPPASAGTEASLMNFPVVEAEDMPAISAGSLSIAFGDFRRGYLVVDRVGVRVLRDPYSAKPYVLFYTTKRVGGGVQDFDAIKLLKFAA